MLFENPRAVTFECAIDVQRDATFQLPAAHKDSPDFLAKNFRNLRRAVEICDRTVAGEEPRIRATSPVLKPSISRKSRAARSFSGRVRSPARRYPSR